MARSNYFLFNKSLINELLDEVTATAIDNIFNVRSTHDVMHQSPVITCFMITCQPSIFILSGPTCELGMSRPVVL